MKHYTAHKKNIAYPKWVSNIIDFLIYAAIMGVVIAVVLILKIKL